MKYNSGARNSKKLQRSNDARKLHIKNLESAGLINHPKSAHMKLIEDRYSDK